VKAEQVTPSRPFALSPNVACFGLIARRAQAKLRNLLRSDTPEHVIEQGDTARFPQAALFIRSSSPRNG
jgi:hypothetical protein